MTQVTREALDRILITPGFSPEFVAGGSEVGLAKRIEDGRYGLGRIVFGDEPAEASEPARNPKRRANEGETRYEQRKQKHRGH